VVTPDAGGNPSPCVLKDTITVRHPGRVVTHRRRSASRLRPPGGADLVLGTVCDVAGWGGLVA
jgi:hypothetical protein